MVFERKVPKGHLRLPEGSFSQQWAPECHGGGLTLEEEAQDRRTTVRGTGHQDRLCGGLSALPGTAGQPAVRERSEWGRARSSAPLFVI